MIKWKEVLDFGEALEKLVLGETIEERREEIRRLLSLKVEDIYKEIYQIREDWQNSKLGPTFGDRETKFAFKIEFLNKLGTPDSRELYIKSLQYLLDKYTPSQKITFTKEEN